MDRITPSTSSPAGHLLEEDVGTNTGHAPQSAPPTKADLDAKAVKAKAARQRALAAIARNSDGFKASGEYKAANAAADTASESSRPMAMQAAALIGQGPLGASAAQLEQGEQAAREVEEDMDPDLALQYGPYLDTLRNAPYLSAAFKRISQLPNPPKTTAECSELGETLRSSGNHALRENDIVVYGKLLSDWAKAIGSSEQRLEVAREDGTAEDILAMMARPQNLRGHPATVIPLAENVNMPPPVLASMLAGENVSEELRAAIAENPSTPEESLEKLASDVSVAVRLAVAANVNTPEKALSGLAAAEQDEDVREAAVENLKG